jgi:hypothetical protein
MTTDAARLREALVVIRRNIGVAPGTFEDALKSVADAAEAHLATLPRTKPMWFVIWAVRDIFRFNHFTSASLAESFVASIHPNHDYIATVGPYEVAEG